MLNPTVRNAMAAGLLMAAMVAAPTESRACDWLFGGWGAQTTYNAPAWGSSYTPGCAPVYVSLPGCNTCPPTNCNTCAPASCNTCAPAPYYSGANCSSCAPQATTTFYSGSSCTSCTAPTTSFFGGSSGSSSPTQTVGYAPQVSYQTVYRAVPVATYQAVTRPAFLTGRPVTYYRPSVTWTYQAQAVPYTSNYTGSCNTCAVAQECSTCTTTTPTENINGAADSSPKADTPAYPSLDAAGLSPKPAPATFQGDSETSVNVNKPVPDPEANSIPGPDLTNPGSRTTMRPVHQAVHYVQVASPSSESCPVLDAGGWSVSED